MLDTKQSSKGYWVQRIVSFKRPAHETHGCEICRGMALLYFEPPVAQVGSLGGGHLLFRCGACGALWEETLRFNAPIDEAEAKALCPTAFEKGSAAEL